MVVQDGKGPAPLLLVSITADRLDPIALGFSQLEEAALAPDQLSAEKAAVAATMLLPFDGAVKTDLPLLIGR